MSDIQNARWRYVVKARYGDTVCTVDKFWKKQLAKELRNKLRLQFGAQGAEFYLVWDRPRPHWAQLKAFLMGENKEAAE